MVVILTVSLESDGFALGRALKGDGTGHIELERLVPHGSVVPFFWMFGGDPAALEATVEASDSIEDLVELEQIGDRRLYRVGWAGEDEDLLRGIASTGGTILEAESDGAWSFRLRFPDHQQIAAFYNYCTEIGLDIRVGKVYTLTEESLQDRLFGLTPAQREALSLALDEGYFETPRRTTMEVLATELDISQQAFSDRLRRGEHRVLKNVLRG